MTSQCPNEFPSTSASYRIALCGESPGEREVALHRPFVGAAGAHLDRMLAGAGIIRSACFVGNVCQIRPAENDFNTLDWRGDEVQDGIAALLADLAQFAPNLVVTLGNVPLHLFKSGNQAPSIRCSGTKRVFDWPRKITIWRGSLFMSSPRAWDTDVRLLTPSPEVVAVTTGHSLSDGAPSDDREQRESADQVAKLNRQVQAGEWPAQPLAPATTVDAAAAPSNQRNSVAVPRPAWKCLSTLHPAYTLRAWAENFNLRQDLRRARAEGESPVLVLPELDFQYGP